MNSSTASPSPTGDSHHQFEVELSSHCIARYREHLRPCLDHQLAGDDLEQLLSNNCEIAFDRPDWVRSTREDADAWALVGPNMALPLVKTDSSFVAVTTMVSGNISPKERSRRKNHRKATRQRRSF